jgi:acyl-CoA reductase-like NAD-dependent aldehyde dehydrogenase
VAAAAAPDLKRLTLELGGNDAAIVLPDVDPAAIADKLFWGAFENSGQVCSAVKRVYVHEDRYEAAARRAGAARERREDGRRARRGHAARPGQQPAPVPRVSELVTPRQEGRRARALRRQRAERRGLLLRADAPGRRRRGRAIVDEEQFGPALPVLPTATWTTRLEPIS